MTKRKIALALAGLLAVTACGSQTGPANSQNASQPATSSAAAGSTDQTSATLTIFAAASLKDVFPKIYEEFKKTHPNYTIEFSFAGSSELATQINNGAEADVFASANEKQMKVASDAGNVDAAKTKIFATNTLTLITPPSNPAGIAKLEDVTKDGVKLVVCAEQVPCGAATKQLAEKTGFTFNPVSEEQKVTDVVTKVTSGEADAGLVYVTDATSAKDKVKTVETPEADQIVNKYPIAVTKSAREGAQAFVDFVLAEQGQSMLQDAGFGAPK